VTPSCGTERAGRGRPVGSVSLRGAAADEERDAIGATHWPFEPYRDAALRALGA
jgi:hypothetical protein